MAAQYPLRLHVETRSASLGLGPWVHLAGRVLVSMQTWRPVLSLLGTQSHIFWAPLPGGRGEEVTA